MQKRRIDGWVRAGLTLGFVSGCGGDNPRDTAGSQTSIGSITMSGSGTEEGTDSVDGTESADETQSESGSNSSNPSQASNDDNDSGFTKFDLGLQPDVTLVEETGCTKVDFLFVIDNSGSMEDDQINLAANVPNFVSGITATLSEVDEYQVGVVTSDDYAAPTFGGGVNPPGCRQLGALVTSTTAGGACGPYVDGFNHMTESDNLAVAFDCAIIVGAGGSGLERPMNAVEVAVRKDLDGPGACNEGFIRDDALLVIVIITDEWDGPGDTDPGGSSGDANSWFQTVVNSKAGIEENVVVLSLIHFNPTCPPLGQFAMLSGDIEPFTNMFTNGFLGCIEDDYAQVFDEATSLIEDACENFTPPG